MSAGQQQPGYYQPGMVRLRPKTELSRHSVIQRYYLLPITYYLLPKYLNTYFAYYL